MIDGHDDVFYKNYEAIRNPNDVLMFKYVKSAGKLQFFVVLNDGKMHPITKKMSIFVAPFDPMKMIVQGYMGKLYCNNFTYTTENSVFAINPKHFDNVTYVPENKCFRLVYHFKNGQTVTGEKFFKEKKFQKFKEEVLNNIEKYQQNQNLELGK